MGIDPEAPLHIQRDECIRLLDVALMEAKARGRRLVEAEAAYYSAKAHETFELLEQGYANTTVQGVIKGQDKTGVAMRAYHAAQVEYDNAKEAINVYKLKLRSLEAEIEREWEQARRQ